MKIVRTLVPLVLALVATSCGGPTLEEYFTELMGLHDEFETRSNDLNNEMQADLQAATSPDEAIDRLRVFLEDTEDLMSEAIARHGDLDPPAEAEAAHAEYLDSLENSRDALGQAIDDLQSIPLEQIETLFTEGALAEASEQALAACNELQTVADDGGLEIDLECERSP